MKSGLHIGVPRGEDCDALHAAVRESVEALLPWMPWCQPGYGRANALDWIKRSRAGHALGKGFEFCIFDDGALVGCCGLNRINHQDCTANLGYWVRSSRTREGIATNAVRRVVGWAFANTALERLEIVAAVENLASQAVALRAGATREAVLRHRTMQDGRSVDAVVFSVLRGDCLGWRSHSEPQSAGETSIGLSRPDFKKS